MSAEFGPRLEELLSVEGAFEHYRNNVFRSDMTAHECEMPLLEELQARIGFRINVTGVRTKAAVFMGHDAQGRQRFNLVRCQQALVDGRPQSKFHEGVLIRSVDVKEGALHISDITTEGSYSIMPICFIESIEVTEPLAA